MKNKFYNGYRDYDDIIELSEKEQVLIAKELSEGDENLEKLLLNCWKNKIRTMACCRGHDEIRLPYIMFKLDKDSLPFCNYIMNHIRDKDLHFSEISISTFNQLYFSIHSNFLENNTFFSRLNEFLSKEKILVGEENDILTCAYNTCLASIKNNFLVIITIDEAEDMTIQIEDIIPEGSIRVMNAILQDDLSNHIEQIRNTKELCHGLYSCDKDSLKAFYELFNLNTNTNLKQNR